MSKILFSIALFFVVVFSFAQSSTILGKVVDVDGEPIVGATILQMQTGETFISNVNGDFEFTYQNSEPTTLLVHYIGYLSKEVNLNEQELSDNALEIVLEQDFLQLEQVVVTATRNEILRKDAPIVCQIIDNKILKATQSVTLSEGLSFQPALRVESNCQNCGFSGLRMNGLEGAYSQILIDGRPIFNSLQGVYGLEQIPANMIERVEIVRSGGSALYGSSAVAGTVNVITKEPTQNSTYLRTNQATISGSAPDRTYMLGTDLVKEEEKVGVSLNGYHRNRAHWDSNGDDFSEIGDITATNFSLKAFYKPTDRSKLTLNGYSIYEFRRGGNDFDLAFHQTDITESTTHNILNGGLTYEQFSKNEDHKYSAYVSTQNLKRDSYYGGGEDINAYCNSKDLSTVAGLQYTGNLGYFAGGNHTLVTGVEYNNNHLNDNAPAYNRVIDQTAEQLGFYTQDMWEIGDNVNLLIGNRMDKHNLVDKAIFSPRANIMWEAAPDLQFRVGYARGFRAPQVFDEDLHITQVGGEGTVITNAANLIPEYSNAYSTSVDYNVYKKNWALGLTVDGFHTQLSDVFILEEMGNSSNGDLLLERRNGDEATVTGVTFSPKFQYKDQLSLQLGFTKQKSLYSSPVQWSETVENDSKKFFRTPDEYGFYVANWSLNDRFAVNLSGVYTGSMLAQHYAGYIAEDVLEKTPSFFENNIKFDYNLNLSKSEIQLTAGVQNIANAYQEDFDQSIDRDSAYIYGPSRPRTFFVGTSIIP